jgi:hypothetical protein
VPALALVHCPYPLPVDGAPPLFSGLRPMDGRSAPCATVCPSAAWQHAPAGTRRAAAQQGARRAGARAAGELGRRSCSAPGDLRDDGAGARLLQPRRAPRERALRRPAFEPYPREWRSPWPSDNSDPLVLVSFSTSYMNQLALAQRVLDALAGLPVRALLTAGPALDAQALRIPANARTVAYIPHRTVLPHAALVVTHAAGRRSTRRSPTACRSSASPTGATSPTTRRACSPPARACASARAPRPASSAG